MSNALTEDEYIDDIGHYLSLVADAPFRDTYHEYILKRLIRLAAEQGYDSIGWTTADIQSERWSEIYAEGYRIEYDQDIPKFLKKYGKEKEALYRKRCLLKPEEFKLAPGAIEFLDYLKSIDRAKTTIYQYEQDLNIFWTWNLQFNGNKEFKETYISNP